MRKTLLSFLIVLLLAVIVFMVFNKLDIGNIHILGVKKLSEENKKLDNSIMVLTNMNNNEYVKAVKDINDSATNYSKTKKEYDEIATVSSDAQIGAASQLQKYEIEYLWTRIGTHASNENVVLRMEIKANSSSSATGYYDLNFAALGDYVGVTDFIYDIENDSSLGFKIENFKMEPSGSNIQATFVCTSIAINIDPSELSGASSKDENSEENNKEENKENENTNTTNDSSKNTDAVNMHF